MKSSRISTTLCRQVELSGNSCLGRTFEDYTSDELLRSAIERKFEIMGEALTRVRRDAPEILQHIRDHRDIISFRNILVHGYDVIDDQIVWGVIEEDLDALLEDVEKLIP